jgi:hypothetical protein
MLNTLLDKKGRINRRLCNESRYKEEEKHILNYIYSNTKFLDNKEEICLKERIFCVVNNIKELPICVICNIRTCKFITNSKFRYSHLCRAKECYVKDRQSNINKILKNRWKNHIKKPKIKISKKERYENMVKTRKNNKNWFTDEQVKYINEQRKLKINKHDLSNKLKQTWSNPKLRLKQSQTIKKLIQDNKFTPPKNTWSKWKSIYLYNGKKYKFRSSWEAAFWSANKHLEYEQLRIPYIYNDNEHIYIVDFIDRLNKTVYEIKPKSKMFDKEISKENSLLDWCSKNNFVYLQINESWFYENYNNIDFSNNEWLIKCMKQFKPNE